MNLLSKISNWLFGSKESETPLLRTLKNKTLYKPPKDDFTTPWIEDKSYCIACKKSTDREEYLRGRCSNCGSAESQVLYGRIYRKVYIGGEWKYQVKYKDGQEETVDNWD